MRTRKQRQPKAPIPIEAAKKIAELYGYDQVMIYARRIGDGPSALELDPKAEPGGEHMTTYGINAEHCSAMARIAQFLQTKIMGWTKENG
jgi:hypothetical protein